MSPSSRVHDVKKERKKALFLREITAFIQSIGQEEPLISQIYVNRVELSDDYKLCYIYVVPYATNEAKQEIIDKAIEVLKLYRPSIRQAIAKKINPRYTPDVRFIYDAIKEKQQTVNDLLDKVHEELKNANDD